MRTFEINFNGNTLALVEVENNQIRIINACDGWEIQLKLIKL